MIEKTIKKAIVPFETVKAEENTKIMLGSTQIMAGEDGSETYQSANRNVITVVKDGYYHHIILTDIVNAMLKERSK